MFEGEAVSGFGAAVVVFQDEVSLWWLRLLRPGFRHCYLLLPCGENSYLELNAYSNCLLVQIRRFGVGYDYLAELERQGKTLIRDVLVEKAPLKPAPLAPFSCVELVKRVLGIHDFFLITPNQLYKKIKNCRKKVLTKPKFYDTP